MVSYQETLALPFGAKIEKLAKLLSSGLQLSQQGDTKKILCATIQVDKPSNVPW